MDRPKRIIACLSHPVPDVRLVGVDLVNMLLPMMDRKSIEPGVIEQLRKLVNDPDAQVRLQTVRVLGDLRNAGDAPLLLDALSRETDPAISQAITRALGSLHNPVAVPVLLKTLNDGDGPMAAEAAAALSLLCQKPDRAITGEEYDSVVKALSVRMASAKDKALRQAILDAMARIADERFREQFMAGLQSPDLALRQSAVKAFAVLDGPDDAEKVLAPQLADTEAVVREAVCTALGKVGKPSQLGLLLQHCDEQAEPNLAVRRAAEDAAISVILRMDRPALRSQLERMATTPGQAQTLATVLEKAAAQTAQNPDAPLMAVLNRALAETRMTAGRTAEAADLWVKVVLSDPTDAGAVGMLAKVLVQMGSAEATVSAVQQIAGGQSGALADVLAALGKEVKAAQDGPRLGRLGDALAKIDTSSWSTLNQDALRAFIKTCSGQHGAASTRPATAGPEATAGGGARCRVGVGAGIGTGHDGESAGSETLGRKPSRRGGSGGSTALPANGQAEYDFDALRGCRWLASAPGQCQLPVEAAAETALADKLPVAPHRGNNEYDAGRHAVASACVAGCCLSSPRVLAADIL